MIETKHRSWETKRTDETREVERVLKEAGFEDVAAYRYNSASIRVRVIDPRFEGMPEENRDAMVERVLEKLPERTQADILNLFTFSPTELQLQSTSDTLRQSLMNLEFEDPSPSIL